MWKTTPEGEPCDCELKIGKTTVRYENDQWHVKYEWEKLQESVTFKTDDFSEILFPPTNYCPDRDDPKEAVRSRE